ncbi:HAD-like protein [Dioscorea alata]|uniref:HAD-like protein n=1 Tax=Dioscorea alata TaxID=55571 RepID=A0ACB7V1D3_DIOAL|nr:HAD-like protein [Dioscorea alata]
MLHPFLRRLPSITHPLSRASVHRRRCAAMAESPARYLIVATTRKASLKGVVFDMDGTLTVPVIDFPAMYRTVLGEDTYASLRSASPSGSIDILHHIETWAPAKQQRAYEIIADFERQGIDRLQIMPVALELCGFLDLKKIRRGLITRNVDATVDLFHQRFGLIPRQRSIKGKEKRTREVSKK